MSIFDHPMAPVVHDGVPMCYHGPVLVGSGIPRPWIIILLN